MNKRMDRRRLNIGVYFLRSYARTERHIRELAECGVDFVTCMENDRETLDMFYRLGIGAIVSGIAPPWWGGDGENAGTMAAENPIEKYLEAAKGFDDHPAIWGIDVGDEPSALDFPHYGRVMDCVDTAFPNQFAYLNIYPNYASVAENNALQTVNQLGTPTYGEYIEEYCKHIRADYLCFDFYPYAVDMQRFYRNLVTVADACKKTGKSMWIVLQVNSSVPEVWISENRLRLQAFSAMAFGAENIIWACYTAGWWHNQVLDKEGNKTEQYEKLKKVNREIRLLADRYMRFKRIATHLVGVTGDGVEFVEKAELGGSISKVRASDGSPILVGEMVSRSGDGSEAIMLCGVDDPYDESPKEYSIIFHAKSGVVRAFGGDGELFVSRRGEDEYSVSARSNSGILVTWEKI
ncbi:MAG: hypothetical protein IJY04_07280 [Clostridia bacterium]|nr:hypothetical protein [Clostridia bacterium]